MRQVHIHIHRRKRTRDAEPCYSCGKPMKSERFTVYTADDGGQIQYVGPECFRKIKAAGSAGFQPPLGGPRLYIKR